MSGAGRGADGGSVQDWSLLADRLPMLLSGVGGLLIILLWDILVIFSITLLGAGGCFILLRS